MRRASSAPDHCADLLLLGRQPVDDLAAGAPGGAPADASRFEHRHAITALGQRQRRRATRDAAADHAHVGACTRLPSGGAAGGGGVLAAYQLLT